MSKLWPVVTKQAPCPVCGHGDWCALGEHAIKCMRVQSPHPSKDGGWYHPYTNAERPRPVFIPRKKQPVIPSETLEQKWRYWRIRTNGDKVFEFANSLGLELHALNLLDIAWDDIMKAWLFPMRDGEGNIIGIRTRKETGEKRSYLGSKNGLFIPNFIPPQTMAFIPEGPTDTVACFMLGFLALGRPSANAGETCNEYIKVALKRLSVRRAVIVADNDEVGINGAKALGKHLKMPHLVWIPPAKDMREFLRMGGTKQMVESSIKQMVWRR